MSITEIEKLREKVAKDPNSRLYVPLAEEYRKEGRMDEAIEVLQKGLERHPSYMSARVSLGKIYYAKGQIDEARIEFETVTKSIPDNLYAHKKLAEIYRDTGKKDLAIKAFKTVLKLNPVDEEALNSLRFLEGASAGQTLEKLPGPVAPPEESPADAMVLEQTTHDQQEVEETKVEENEESVEELDSFKDSLFGLKAEATEEVSEEAEELQEEAAKEEVSAETIEIPEEADEGLSFGDVADALRAEDLRSAGEVEETPEDMVTPIKDKSLTGFTAEMTPEADSGSQQDKGMLLQTADRLITEGKYLGAIHVYKQILAVAAGDKQTLQRIEELRSLLNLMGNKDEEVLITKLNEFLSALIKRGDEFHRRS